MCFYVILFFQKRFRFSPRARSKTNYAFLLAGSSSSSLRIMNARGFVFVFPCALFSFVQKDCDKLNFSSYNSLPQFFHKNSFFFRSKKKKVKKSRDTHNQSDDDREQKKRNNFSHVDGFQREISFLSPSHSPTSYLYHYWTTFFTTSTL